MLESKPIRGYEGLYKISNDGWVYSFAAERHLTFRLANRGKGYRYVSLWKDGQERKMYVHRLVALHFIPNPDNKETVNHKDGNTTNNSWRNLEWMTHQEQQDHAWATGLTDNRGSNCGTSKLFPEQVLAMRSRYEAGGVTQLQLAEEYRITQGQVSKIVNDKRWKEVV